MILLDDESEPRVSQVDDKLLFNYHSCISDLSQFYCCFIFFQIEIVILTKLIKEDNRFINQILVGLQ